VLFVIRTYERPWRSRPSAPLAASVIAVVVIGFILPVSPLARVLGFVPLPATYLAFVAMATVLYLGLVEIAKRALVRRGTLGGK
jgi:Mg2+-importing ATPase